MNIYGASGHAKVLIEIIHSFGGSVNYIFDDDPEIEKVLNYPVFHEILPEMIKLPTVIGVGNNIIRKKISLKFQGAFTDALIHQSAVVSESAQLGKGSVLMANSVVNAQSVIKSHCIINSGSIIEHDNIIDHFVHVSPGAVLTGNVTLGEGTHIGAGAVILPGVKIGRWVTVGAGALILKDVPDFAVVVGNPGKVIKYNTVNNE
ncbi:acetyltransferase [Autumnicola psychrophila]|uniref:Acetyltransferase n=1 Tax=Autumnicola psychrophila TaxID=3075592 RepID=A0ABU3DS70_9FLAO|nr:acetyltransferase [Zunongwangia sp. F225]MDT0686545.1 acetyltransferase [Zunongwangia sp. F225]